MSNDNPPRACLADFGFMTMVLDPGQPISCSAQLEGGTAMFMSPELLVPSKFGFAESIPTPEADIYAFGLVIYQVCEQDRGHLPFTHVVQVLTGETPFRGTRTGDIALNVVQGVRPPKPEDASTIGFSDSLWDFVQRCWDDKMESRPKVAEVEAQLERAAADWGGAMPPCVQVKNIAPAPPELVSDLMGHCEFETLSFWNSLLSNYKGGIFSSVPRSYLESSGVLTQNERRVRFNTGQPLIFKQPHMKERSETHNPPSPSISPTKPQYVDPSGSSRLTGPAYTSAEIPAATRRQPPQMRVHRLDNGSYITFSQVLPGASAAIG